MAKLTMDDVDKRLEEIRNRRLRPQGNTVAKLIAAKNKLVKPK